MITYDVDIQIVGLQHFSKPLFRQRQSSQETKSQLSRFQSGKMHLLKICQLFHKLTKTIQIFHCCQSCWDIRLYYKHDTIKVIFGSNRNIFCLFHSNVPEDNKSNHNIEIKSELLEAQFPRWMKFRAGFQYNLYNINSLVIVLKRGFTIWESNLLLGALFLYSCR